MANSKLKALVELLKRETEFQNEPRYYYKLVLAYLDLGVTLDTAKEKAVEAANKTIDLEPNNPMHYRLLGYVYYWFNDPNKAIEHTEKALSLAQEQENEKEAIACKNNLAFYYAQRGKKADKEVALSYAEQACKMEKSDINLDTLGYVKMKFGETKEEIQEAIEILEQITKLHPTHPDYIAHLEEAYRKLIQL